MNNYDGGLISVRANGGTSGFHMMWEISLLQNQDSMETAYGECEHTAPYNDRNFQDPVYLMCQVTVPGDPFNKAFRCQGCLDHQWKAHDELGMMYDDGFVGSFVPPVNREGTFAWAQF